MIEIKGIGTFESIPQLAAEIIAGDTNALDNHLLKKWKIDKKIKLECRLGGVFEYTPLELALMAASFDSIKWLVEHGVNLNAIYNYTFQTAVRYCDEDIVRFLVEHGARVVSDQKYGTDAFEQALYGDKLKNLPVIHELGHTVELYGGNAFFSAIMDNNIPAVTFFVENGIDINADVNIDSQFKTTPLCAAARYADLELCKYLVVHGADVTIAEKSGMRPYNIALERSEFEMAEFFKSLEPADFHNLQNKLAQLKSYKLPVALLDFLQGDNLRFDFGKRASIRDCEYIDFLPITDTLPMKAGRQKLLRISRIIENYEGATHIVWNPKSKMVAFYDEEHSELSDMASFEDFINNPAEYIQKVINGTL